MDSIFYWTSPITQVWALLSLPLILAIYFRFGRIWSLRNLDLMILLAIALGVIVADGKVVDRTYWLCTATGILLLRLLCDPILRRRPRIDTNVNSAGLAMLGLTGLGLIVVATFDGLAHQPAFASTDGRAAIATPPARETDNGSVMAKSQAPTTTLFEQPVLRITDRVTAPVEAGLSQDAAERDAERTTSVERITAGTLVVIGHLMVISALIVLGAKTFGDPKAGIAMAALYCLLPCTVIVPRSIQYILPSGLILWAFVAHRKPVISGVLLGLACGAHVFPFVLLPIWIVYYGRKSGLRFAGASLIVMAALFGSFAIVSPDVRSFLSASLGAVDVGGFWIPGGELSWLSFQNDPVAMYATLAAVVGLVIALTVWPKQKSFEHLLSQSVAIIVAVFLGYSIQTDWFLPGVIPFVIVVAYRPMASRATLPSRHDMEEASVRGPHALIEGRLVGSNR